MFGCLFGLIELCSLLFVFLFVIRICFADCDTLLHFYKLFGAKGEQTLRGNVVWITGASSGIGEYLAYELTRFGCKLVLSARRKDELERVKNRCVDLALERSSRARSECEEDFLVLAMDVTEYSTHNDLTSTVLQKFGKIDILVNNAGVLQMGGAIETCLDFDEFIMRVNVLGPISLTKAVLPHMIRRKTGQIVVMSSASGKSGAGKGLCLYTASKHALQGYFNTLRMEVHSENVGVTLVCPGMVFSDILKNALQENPQSHKNLPFPPKTIETESCVKLIGVAIANRLDEVWIAIPARLASLYAVQYLPWVLNWWK